MKKPGARRAVKRGVNLGGGYVLGPRLAFLLSPCLLVSLSPCLLPTVGASDNIIDSVMYQDPDPPKARLVNVFPERLKVLWLEALERPEADYQCKAALAITLAHQRGMKGLETTVTALLRVFDLPVQHVSVRLAVSRALLELDAKEAAPNFFRQAQAGDSDLCALIEPALARWNYVPMRAVWLERLSHPNPRRGALVLAIKGLTTVQEPKAAPFLHELVRSRHPSPEVYLEGARALGVLQTAGLENDAERLATDATEPAITARLAAAWLLRHHQGDRAVRLMQELSQDAEPVVAAVALARLVEIDPRLVFPVLDLVLANPDAKVRLFAVEALFRQPTAEHIRLLADRLDDRHPDVRVKARQSLAELARRPNYLEPVLRQTTRVITANGWRGQEQAIILLTQLEHKGAAERLVELLASGRPEVFVAAAWGLRKLAVPATLPAVLDYLKLQEQHLLRTGFLGGRKEATAAAIEQQLSQLAQLLGQSRYRPADAALRLLVPREANPVGRETRAAGIWALGLLHEGKPVPDLVRAYEERLNDVIDMARGGEDARVRRMSAISLGRMKAKEALGTLRKYYKKPSPDPINNACGWAIEQITGEAMPPAETVIITVTPSDWFLSPLGS